MNSFQEIFAQKLVNSKGRPFFFGDKLTLKDGRPTPYFVNMGGLLQDASGLWILGVAYGKVLERIMNEHGFSADIVSGPSYKGGPIAQAMSTYLYQMGGIDLGVNTDRKEVKTHGEGSGKSNTFVGAQFFDGCNIIIVDDVASTMRSKYVHLEKIMDDASSNDLDVKVNAVIIGVDREQVTLDGLDAIAKFTEDTDIPVFPVLTISELIGYCLEHTLPVPYRLSDGTFIDVKVTDNFIDTKFRPYMEMYGVKDKRVI